MRTAPARPSLLSDASVDPFEAEAIGATLLAWYDVNARALPWRVPPAMSRAGHLPDPYHVWLSEVMLQQTTVTAVIPYFTTFLRRWPTIGTLAAADEREVMAAWAGLGYYARARNLVRCARKVVAEHGGRFPKEEAALLALPGIGPYTAAAIRAIAFGKRAVVVDGNVERVMARLFAVGTPLPAAKAELKALAAALTPASRPGDHAQALMDLGATICTPATPACGACPLGDRCRGRARGIAAELPRRERRKARPVRFGTAFVARRADGALLLERRPPEGLLGGMLAFPTTPWSSARPEAAPPLTGDWRRLEGEVRHVFTHFALHLELFVARLPLGVEAPPGLFFLPDDSFRMTDLPSLMRKVWRMARPALEGQVQGP